MSSLRLFSSLLPKRLFVPQPSLLSYAAARTFHTTLQPASAETAPRKPHKLTAGQIRAAKEKRIKIFRVRQTLNAAKKAVRDQTNLNQDFLEVTEDPNSFLGKIYTTEKVKEFTRNAREAGVLTGESEEETKRVFFEDFDAAEPLSDSSTSEVLKLPLSHQIQAEESELVFTNAPLAEVAANSGTIVTGTTEERLDACKKKAELVSKIVSLSLESERGLKSANIRRACQIFGKSEGDTSSPEVQCAVMSVKIYHMQRHMLSNHRKDFSCKRRLQLQLHKRRKLMKYLKNQSQSRYYDALHKIGLKEVIYI